MTWSRTSVTHELRGVIVVVLAATLARETFWTHGLDGDQLTVDSRQHDSTKHKPSGLVAGRGIVGIVYRADRGEAAIRFEFL